MLQRAGGVAQDVAWCAAVCQLNNVSAQPLPKRFQIAYTFIAAITQRQRESICEPYKEESEDRGGRKRAKEEKAKEESKRMREMQEKERGM